MTHERPSPPSLAILGASGFIGSAVARASRAADPQRARALVHRGGRPGGTAVDVRDAAGLGDALHGAEVVVHAASYIGNDPARCREVNVAGTANVVAASRTLGVRRLIYVSTTAVYGRGPFVHAGEEELPRRPASTLSSSRADAEEIVLDAGGIVVRPHLVLGAGDRWVEPGIANLAKRLGGLPESVARARHSVIDVDDLGAVVHTLADAEVEGGRAYHVACATPATVDEIRGTLADGGVDLPIGTVPDGRGAEAAADDPTVRHALALLGVDHTFSVGRVASIAGVTLPARLESRGEARRSDGDAR